MYGPVKFNVTESRIKGGLSKYRFGVKSQRRRPLIWTSIKMVKCGKLVLIMNGEFFFFTHPCYYRVGWNLWTDSTESILATRTPSRSGCPTQSESGSSRESLTSMASDRTNGGWRSGTRIIRQDSSLPSVERNPRNFLSHQEPRRALSETKQELNCIFRC